MLALYEATSLLEGQSLELEKELEGRSQTIENMKIDLYRLETLLAGSQVSQVSMEQLQSSLDEALTQNKEVAFNANFRCTSLFPCKSFNMSWLKLN
jgi:hypothetical protein